MRYEYFFVLAFQKTAYFPCRNKYYTTTIQLAQQFNHIGVQTVLEDHSDRRKKNKQVVMSNACVTLRSV